MQCEYVRVEGIDGRNIENDESAKEILQPREELVGTKFCCKEINESWVYDGTVHTSFPGLHLYGHHGTKGLTLSNIKCFDIIQKEYPNYEWYCILEDDSEINEEIYKRILDIAKYNPEKDVVLLDKRGRGGTCALLYNQRIIKKVRNDMHPLSEFLIHNETRFMRGTNLCDWKLWVYLDHFTPFLI